MNEGDAMETSTGIAAVAIKGSVGLIGVVQGIVINNLKDVNVVLQTISLTLGIIVALAAVVSIVMKRKP
jgi:hypothetical protein